MICPAGRIGGPFGKGGGIPLFSAHLPPTAHAQIKAHPPGL